MTEIIYPELSYQVQGAFFDVHNELRHSGISEAAWETALCIVLQERGIAARRQAEYELRYKGYRIGRFFLDVVVDEKIILELKATDGLLPIDQAQLIAYLKATGLKLGILANFGRERVEYKRIPNFVSERRVEEPTSEIGIGSGDSDLVYELRGALYAVHRELGPGFRHKHYRRATQIELRLRQIPYEPCRNVTILFRGQPIETRWAMLLVVSGSWLVWVRAVREIDGTLRSRFRLYMKLLGYSQGMIVNFQTTSLAIETIRL